MKSLKKFSQENSRFLSLKNGESVVATFKGYSFGMSKYDPEREEVIYSLETENGPKSWTSSSGKVAEFFNDVVPDQRVQITRVGEGTKTSYQLAVVEK